MSFFKECIDIISAMELDAEYQKFEEAFNSHHRFIIIGNGGSNSIASHMSQDFVKRSGKRSLSFSDPSMLTCFMNDYGVDEAYRKFLEFYSDSDTMVILISSSGKSKNILNCVEFCKDSGIDYGVLSAFDSDNPLRTVSDTAKFNYYVDTHDYGVAECMHQLFLHAIV